MKILFVVEHFYPHIGGTERLFFSLAKELTCMGHQVKVVTTRYKRELPRYEFLEGFEIYRVSCFNRFIFTIAALPLVWKHAADADIIHTTSYNAAFPSWLIGKLRRKKLLITFHEVWARLWWKLPFLNFFQRLSFYTIEQLLLRLDFDFWVGVSDYTRNCLLKAGLSPDRVLTIYNGIDYSNPLFDNRPTQSRQNHYLFFGRQGVSKGLDLLLPAFLDFVREFPEEKLILVLSNRNNRITRWVDRFVTTHPVLREKTEIFFDLEDTMLFSLIRDSFAVIIPSYSEGFCYAAVEVTTLNVPVICSKNGSLPEVVGGKTIFIDPFSSKGLLDSLVKSKMNKWQVRNVIHFALANTLRSYLEAYQRLCQK